MHAALARPHGAKYDLIVHNLLRASPAPPHTAAGTGAQGAQPQQPRPRPRPRCTCRACRARRAMPKVQPPELKKFMDKKLNSGWPWLAGWLARAACTHAACARAPPPSPSPSPCMARHRAHHEHHAPLPPAPAVALNANRQIQGVLRGFDQFMNLVLDGTVDVKNKTDIGMVVSTAGSQGRWRWRCMHGRGHAGRAGRARAASAPSCARLQVVRGNSIITIEAMEPIH